MTLSERMERHANGNDSWNYSREVAELERLVTIANDPDKTRAADKLHAECVAYLRAHPELKTDYVFQEGE